jgi:hypothetical protein
MAIKIQGTDVINDTRELKNITNADNIIKQPTNQSPTDGATGIGSSSLSLTLSASAYNDLFGGQTSATFQVSDASDFLNLIVNETVSGSSINSYTISDITSILTESSDYYFRVKYTDTNSNESLFSEPTSFTIAAAFVSVDPPTVTSPSDGAADVGEEPTIASSSFSTTGTSDTHASTDWQIASDSSFNTIVFESLNDTSNLVSLTVPEGNLSTSTTYYIRVRHTGANIGDSGYSNTVSFTTASEFLPAGWPGEIGTPYEGGYFAGQIIDRSIRQAGKLYNLVVAPRSSGEKSNAVWADGSADGSNTGADFDTNGPANTNLLTTNYTDTEAALFCDFLGAGGYNWYMPAKNELEVLYYYLKPTTDSNDTGGGANPDAVSPEPINTNYSSSDPSQTSATIFQDGNSEALSSNVYWSSTEYDANKAWCMYFHTGQQDSIIKNYNLFSVRAVRRVFVSDL